VAAADAADTDPQSIAIPSPSCGAAPDAPNGGLKALRAAYTRAYGFRTSSNDVEWLRRKLALAAAAAAAAAAAEADADAAADDGSCGAAAAPASALVAAASRDPSLRRAAAAAAARAAAAAAVAAAEAAGSAPARPRRAAGVPLRYVAPPDPPPPPPPPPQAPPPPHTHASPAGARLSRHFASRRAAPRHAPHDKKQSAAQAQAHYYGQPPAAPLPATAPPSAHYGVPPRCLPLPRVTLGGATFAVGDSVFVLTAAGLRAEITCAACGRADTHAAAADAGAATDGADADAAAASAASSVLVECGRCLSGFHLRCVHLSAVPEGDWACAACAAADPPAPPLDDMARLDSGLLFLARIEALWWDAAARDYFFRARWYHAPRHAGATRWWSHRGAARGGGMAALREVCLGPRADADAAPVSSVVRKAAVLSPAAARAAGRGGGAGGSGSEEAAGGAPLVCHRGYDPAARAFIPLQP
jgi:hypothetical protein